MFESNPIEAYSCDFTPMVSLSADGYVRISLKTLSSISLIHLLSGIDIDNLGNDHEGANLTHISGYTEWVSTTTPTITIGWDWWLDTLQGQPVFKRLDTPRSNLMLIDSSGQDLGSIETSMLLGNGIDCYKWQEEISKYMDLKYS